MISSSHSTLDKQASPKCPALFVFLLIPLFLSTGILAKATLQEPLSPQEKRGKQIYAQGTSASGKEILAYLGESSLEVPGSTMACANCHGVDGQGKSEGGIDPSNLTWGSAATNVKKFSNVSSCGLATGWSCGSSDYQTFSKEGVVRSRASLYNYFVPVTPLGIDPSSPLDLKEFPSA